jgi:hypothetical protein
MLNTCFVVDHMYDSFVATLGRIPFFLNVEFDLDLRSERLALGLM